MSQFRPKTLGLPGVLAIMHLAGLTACATVRPATPESVIATYADLVHRTYAASRGEAGQLQVAVERLLDQPTEVSLDAAKAAWIKARQPYLTTEAFRFYEGPIDAAETGPEPRLNSWPLNESFIDGVEGNPTAGIVNDPSIPLNLETILGKNQVTDEADVTAGWHAIEFLLWGQDLSAEGPGARPASDYVPGETDNDRRREYLRLITAQLVEDLASLESAWRPGAGNYRSEFVRTPEESLGRAMTALATLSGFEVASERIAVALESSSQEDEHSCFSDTTHQDYVFDQRGIENVYFGRVEGSSGPGIHDLLKQSDAELAERVAAGVRTTSEAVGRIHAPFDQVLASPAGDPLRQPVEEALLAFEQQAELFVEAGKSLGLKVEILAE